MHKAHILIVEDDPIIAEDIRTRLEDLGYAILGSTARGEDAVRKAEELRPELVLMDITLKGPMDGIEAGRQIQENLDLPVVFLTAHSDEGTLERAKRIAPHGYILKPFSDRELYSVVETVLYRAGMDRKLKEKERWMATILASIHDAVIAADALGGIVLLNRAAEALTGWVQGDARGLDLGEVCCLHEADGAAADLHFMEVILGEGSKTPGHPVRLVAKDGSRRIVEASASPMADGQGNVWGVVVVLRPAEGLA